MSIMSMFGYGDVEDHCGSRECLSGQTIALMAVTESMSTISIIVCGDIGIAHEQRIGYLDGQVVDFDAGTEGVYLTSLGAYSDAEMQLIIVDPLQLFRRRSNRFQMSGMEEAAYGACFDAQM